ncbi:hypothetical protein MUK42_22697 [Musa troglodytarum]|uniref:RRM domain-containing protein n=1 Tax=Musa troglodytarum TaxID=320322 RepID=A0A9E7K355_9LILI|nr:hypothetical protein MUK42_22697 [Musa troglodytarum]
MAEEKESTSIPLSQAADPEDPAKSPPASPGSSTRKACCAVLHSWASKKFLTGCVVLFPVAVTFYITWWFIQFVDGFFSPLYDKLGFDIFDQNTTAFKEVAIIRHPRIGEYAFGFITSSVVFQSDKGEEELCSVYVPTNHLYIGDIFLVKSEEIIRPNLSVREGIGFPKNLFLGEKGERGGAGREGEGGGAMDFDEYEYLEKAVEEPKMPKEKDRSASRRHGERDKDRGENGEGRASKRSRAEERNGERRDRGDRERPERREKDHHRSGREPEKERDKDRDHRSREREHKDKDKDRERDGGREREREKERERERRSSSRSRRQDKEAEKEMERARSREKRERELEKEIRERESRRFKDKKDVEPEADPERDQRTVFAYQMPLKATERDIYEFFSQVGKVRDVRLIMDRNSRRSKGVGYIEFYDVMSVPLAIALSGQLLLGQPVMVKPSEAEKNLVQSTASSAGTAGAAERKIYVGNLHYNITEEQLRQIFEPFGPVELVQLPLDESGHCRGYGFVQFAQLEHSKAAQSLNGKLDIAGRIIKVSAVTDHVGVQDAGTNAADFDDEDGGGLSLNARSRAILMQKLDRTGAASSIAESLGVPIINGAVPNQQHAFGLLANGRSMSPAVVSAQHTSTSVVEPSECLLLKNMFDPGTETEPDFDLEIKEDVQEECSKFGPVKHIYVEKNSNGFVYLRFESVTAAVSCQRAMQGRWFAGRSVSVTFMRPQEYEAKF